MADRPSPSEDEISQVIDFAGLDPLDDRSMVIEALKETSCNVEAVVMQYFDNPESFRKRFTEPWNQSMYTTDGDGAANNTGISFHIESANNNSNVIQGLTPPTEPYGPTAPSRPPSRSNNISPLGRMLEWARDDEPSTTLPPMLPPMLPSREDEDMQRALRESAQEAGIGIGLIDQQSGIMDTSTSAPAAFGPANRNDYDQGEWAMIRSGPSDTRVAKASAPSLRRRTSGAPAFLVQGVNTVGKHGLGGLLTVLHEIPLARNALLSTGSPAASYGHNSEWWNGQEILPQEVLAQRYAVEEFQWDQMDNPKPDTEEEIHRLMAFLDSTERSYGTVSVLTDVLPYASTGPEKQLYEYLGPRNEEVLRPLIMTAAVSPVFGDVVDDEDVRFGLLELEHNREDYMCITTLYEAIDHTLWSDAFSLTDLHQGSKMAMLKDTSDVLAFKLNGEGPAQSIDIPEKLYLEKYQTSRKDEARRIQLAWCETKMAIARIAKGEMKIHEWKNDWNDMAYDRKQMVGRAMEQWQVYRQYLETLGRFRQMEASGFDTDKYPDYRMAPFLKSELDADSNYEVVEDVLDLTSGMLADMDVKMKKHHAELEQIKTKQRFLGQVLTQPNKSGRPQPMTCKELLLRGVVTQSDVVYVCQRAEPDLIQLESESQPVDQWWRLAYRPDDNEPVKTEKIEVGQVLRQVWDETKVPLLIYATETALSAAPTPLPLPLQRFARADNEAFQAELAQESTDMPTAHGTGTNTTGLPPIDTVSPSKRKHRADSVGSLDSNRAALGSDDGQNGFDNPFEDDGSASTITVMAFPGTPAETWQDEEMTGGEPGQGR
ncbi:hypothetical protein E4U32_000135 [Claviceps aff. humidiphila group G2b]|nr:hypothetical protein E4U32_000135 [Claviceps aff. humidiphila group G2b]